MNEQTKQTICGLLLYLLETASSNVTSLFDEIESVNLVYCMQ